MTMRHPQHHHHPHFEQELQTCRQTLAAVDPEARWKVFVQVAESLALFVGRGAEKQTVVDALAGLADAFVVEPVGTDGDRQQDDVQRIIANEIAAAEIEAEHVPDDIEVPNKDGGESSPPLPYVDLALPITPRKWLVSERIPMRNGTLLSGEGSIGKSLLLMQLSGAVVFAKEWIGTLPEQGPVLFVSCEEEDDEVRRRMEDVARYLDSTRAEMTERGLRVLSFAGRDAILAQPDRAGIMRPTPLFERIRHDAMELHPKLIVLDTVADIFGGKEIDRAQTRQFITLLRGLAIDTNSAVVVAAHPSIAGIASDSGLSGSTGWHNSVRARAYFKAAPGDDNTLRVLECRKNNYGPLNEAILLRWVNGVYVRAEPGSEPLDERSAARVLERLEEEKKVDELFLTLLRRFAKQERNVSDKSGPTYAPAEFAKDPEAKKAKVGNKALAEAMARLFAAEKIKLVTEGSPSRKRSRIIEAGCKPIYSAIPSNAPSNTPTNGLPTPFQRGAVTHPPYPPPPLEGDKGALEGPAPSNGQGSEDEPEMWS